MLVSRSTNEGRTWKNVTANIPGLPAWGTVSNIEPSRYDNGTAYITIDLHQVNNRDPFVYRTNDFGASWKLITSTRKAWPADQARLTSRSSSC